MGSDRQPRAGQSYSPFHTTQWAQIQRLQDADGHRRNGLLGEILQRYWRPVYSYLRRKGNSPADAQDLTQGFFVELIEKGPKGVLAQAAPEKGKFRTFLLTALDRFACDQYRRDHAAKRRPDGGMVRLENADGKVIFDPPDTITPEQIFHYSWASEVMNEVLQAVRHQCLELGQEAHWTVFEERLLSPILMQTEPTGLEELRDRLGLSDTKAVSNMSITVRRRFSAEMRRRVAEWVEDEDEIDLEIQDLIRILSEAGAVSGDATETLT